MFYFNELLKKHEQFINKFEQSKVGNKNKYKIKNYSYLPLDLFHPQSFCRIYPIIQKNTSKFHKNPLMFIL